MGETENVFIGSISGEIVDDSIEVITLTIEGDHSYVAGGIIVHNCMYCAARADKSWTVGEHKPIGHSLPWRVPPIHFNDRCVIVPITKTWRELGADIDEPAQGQRASIDGPLPESTTFDDFLKRKGKAFQDDVLGDGRAELWRTGKITLQDLIAGDGRPLTIEQLRAKYE